MLASTHQRIDSLNMAQTPNHMTLSYQALELDTCRQLHCDPAMLMLCLI
jgi:hypothetical protein